MNKFEPKFAIAIGSDHAGFRYKELIKRHLATRGLTVKDCGTDSETSVDYPDFIFPVALAVQKQEAARGIVLGGSGNGEAMAANKVKGIRACVCWNVESAELARRHNDSNILSLGERMIPGPELFKIVDAWLDTEFEAGRHVRRLEKIEAFRDGP